MYHHVGKELGVLRVAFIRAVVQLLSRVRLFATSWTVAHQALLSMEFFRQKYWSWVAIPLVPHFLYAHTFKIYLFNLFCQ